MPSFNNEQERRDYNSLNERQRKYYDMEKEMDPSTPHSQLMQMAYLNGKLRDITGGGNTNVDIKDPGIISGILNGLKGWLPQFPEIFSAVVDKIDAALEYLGDLIWQGIKNIGETIWDFFDEWF